MDHRADSGLFGRREFAKNRFCFRSEEAVFVKFFYMPFEEFDEIQPIFEKLVLRIRYEFITKFLFKN